MVKVIIIVPYVIMFALILGIIGKKIMDNRKKNKRIMHYEFLHEAREKVEEINETSTIEERTFHMIKREFICSKLSLGDFSFNIDKRLMLKLIKQDRWQEFQK